MDKELKQVPSNCIKVVLFGPESTGKTTLSRHLARYYNSVWVKEYAREYLQNVWNNEIIKKLRKKHIEKKLDNTVCKNCLMGTKEKYEKLTNIPMKENTRLKTTDVIKRTEIVSKSL